MNERYQNLEQAIAARGEWIAPINGESMLPMLEKETDAVRLVPCEGRLKKYDLPLYRGANGKLVLHRIVAVKKDGYLVRGDRCAEVERVPFEAVLAVAVGYFKKGRYISCEDREYLRYAKKQVRIGWLRTARLNIKGLLRHGRGAE